MNVSQFAASFAIFSAGFRWQRQRIAPIGIVVAYQRVRASWVIGRSAYGLGEREILMAIMSEHSRGPNHYRKKQDCEKNH